MHVFPWKSSTSARFKRAHSPPNVWVVRSGGWLGERGVNKKLDDPRPSSELSALSLGAYSGSSFRLRESLEGERMVSVLFLSPPSTTQPPLTAPSVERPWPTLHPSLLLFPPYPRVRCTGEEMCLCLDSSQIICGNKFLCVQCYVIGFISLTAEAFSLDSRR